MEPFLGWLRLELAMREHVPTRTVAKPKAHEPFWFHGQARKLLVNQQRKVYNKYRKTKSECEYRLMQKENKKLLYQSKQNYMQNSLFKPLNERGTASLFMRTWKELRGTQTKQQQYKTERVG